MAAYVKHGDQIVLSLSKAEANALLEVVLAGGIRIQSLSGNPMTVDARLRATRALETAVQPGSRSGAAIT